VLGIIKVMDIIKLIFQPFRSLGAGLSNFSGIIYGTLAFIMFMLALLTTINFGPSGLITTGPLAITALILRKLDQIHKSRD